MSSDFPPTVSASASDPNPELNPDRYVLAGGSGLIGGALAHSLSEAGHDVVVLTRAPADYDGPGRAVEWDGRSVARWQGELEGAAALINLVGRNPAVRWTNENRRQILNSRVESVRVLGEAVAACRMPPRTWLQASAVGIYGDRGDEILDDLPPVPPVAPAGAGFLVDVCRAWEAAFAEAGGRIDPSIRRVTLRIGVVLSRGGGAWPVLRRLTRAFLGGRAGSGRQWVSWIHERDLVRLIRFVLGRSDVTGILNAAAPEPVRNAELMRQARAVLHRPWSPPAPAPVMNLAGRLLKLPTVVVLESQRVRPARLLEAGFEFDFPTLRPALDELAVR